MSYSKPNKNMISAALLASGIMIFAAPVVIQANEAESTPPPEPVVAESNTAVASPDGAVATNEQQPVSANEDAVQPLKAPAENRQTPQEQKDITNFNNIGVSEFSVDETNKKVEVGNSGGDHFAMYGGLNEPTNDFMFEADVDFTPTDNHGNESAALVFGTPSKKRPGSFWYAANVDMGRKDRPDLFRIFGAGHDINTTDGAKRDIDLTRTLHFKIDITADGTLKYTFGNVNTPQYTMTSTIDNWQGGYIGLLSFNSHAIFSHINFLDRMDHSSSIVPSTGTDLPLSPDYKTNLKDTSYLGGTWEVTSDGLHSNAIDKGDTFVYTKVNGTNFVYSTDIKYHSNQGAAGLVFKSNNNNSSKSAYAINLNAGSHKVKLWRWYESEAQQLLDEKDIAPTPDEKYTLKVVSIDSWIQYYVNDVLVASLGDYTLQRNDVGQPTYIKEGYFGLINWNGDVTFQNTYYQALTGMNSPVLKDITVSSSTGNVEGKSQFNPLEPIRIQYVKNNASTIDLMITPLVDGGTIAVYDANGNKIDPVNIPVQEGANYITVVHSILSDHGEWVSATYRINVHRLQADSVYGNEVYRDQYHYSVREGWANDPNGLVYYNGKYHMFYQFYDDIKWGPMHWMHATSTDLLHWQEEPVAFYPDANGTMFSGCIVIDKQNTSGFFESGKGGLVALITTDGNGQRIKLAYSKDEGSTWTKVDTIAADWLDDPLIDAAFRDPKIFRWNDQWFMVVAGGPLRIYSSSNLRTWTLESAYPEINTECPDLYPIQTNEGIKWVLDRGGRTYKVGSFKQVDGKWRFVGDAAYANPNDNGIMNFGKDSYAAMTYYIQDFGSEKHPTLPDIIAMNWMNTWEDYCNQVAEKVGQKFNGTFNLNLKIGLTKNEEGTWVLTQTPIEAYQSLRKEKLVDVKNVEVNDNNSLLNAVKSDTYEIIARFVPGANTTKVGFKVRSNYQPTSNSAGQRKVRAKRDASGRQETIIYYDLTNGTIGIDRSNSGTILTDLFAAINSQSVSRNADGSIDMHIFVDRASVEVFTKAYTAAGANQIFPDAGALFASVFAIGDPAKADITIYQLAKTAFVQPKTPDDKPEQPSVEPTKPSKDAGGKIVSPPKSAWIDKADIVSIKKVKAEARSENKTCAQKTEMETTETTSSVQTGVAPGLTGAFASLLLSVLGMAVSFFRRKSV